MEKKIAAIGLGYVGLPLAVEFAKQYSTVGFDIKELNIRQLTRSTSDIYYIKEFLPLNEVDARL